MAEDFTGKVALVTGGGNGIGAATCRAFAAAGARVAVLDRDAAAAEAVAAEITSRNGHAAAYVLDVADRDAFAPCRLRARPGRDPGQRCLPRSDSDAIRWCDPD